MSAYGELGWRDRAIALASLGAVALSRLAFASDEATGVQPQEMQVLLALALRDSLDAGSPQWTGTAWLSDAVRLDQEAVEELVLSLERAKLVRRSSDAQDVLEIEYELAEDTDDDLIAGELSIVVTELGWELVDRWFRRTRPHFGGWPPVRPDVDDAVG